MSPITYRSYLDDIISSGSLRAIHNLETDPGTLFKGLETFGFNGGVMDEDVLPSILLDKAETLRVIKPLYCSFCHATTPFELSSSSEPYDVSQPCSVGFQLAVVQVDDPGAKGAQCEMTLVMKQANGITTATSQSITLQEKSNVFIRRVPREKNQENALLALCGGSWWEQAGQKD